VVPFPVNPKTSARFREALYPSRSKNDRIDANLLLELLSKHRRASAPLAAGYRGHSPVGLC